MLMMMITMMNFVEAFQKIYIKHVIFFDDDELSSIGDHFLFSIFATRLADDQPMHGTNLEMVRCVLLQISQSIYVCLPFGLYALPCNCDDL